MLSLLLVTLLSIQVALVKADFSQVVYANTSGAFEFTGGIPSQQDWQYEQGEACTPGIYQGGTWQGGALDPLPYWQSVFNASNPASLPMNVSFNFTGTEFNVVGNDWRDGIVTFTLDGETGAPYDLTSATNFTGPRCRFSWYTRSNLTADTHSFTMSLVGPSANVYTDTGVVPGASAYYGLQFYYYSFTPVSTVEGGSQTSTPQQGSTSTRVLASSSTHPNGASPLSFDPVSAVAVVLAMLTGAFIA